MLHRCGNKGVTLLTEIVIIRENCDWLRHCAPRNRLRDASRSLSCRQIDCHVRSIELNLCYCC